MNKPVTAVAWAVVSVCIVMLVIIGLIAGLLWTGGAFKPPTYQQIQQRRARAERRAAFWHVVQLVLLVSVAVLAVTFCVALAKRLLLRANTISDSHGIYPIIKRRHTQWVSDPNGGWPKLMTAEVFLDPNRAPGPITTIGPDGVRHPTISELHPAQADITMGALGVQRQAAANEGSAGLVDVQMSPNAPPLLTEVASRMPTDVEILPEDHLDAILREVHD